TLDGAAGELAALGLDAGDYGDLDEVTGCGAHIQPAPRARMRADGREAVLCDQAPNRVGGGVGLVDAVAVGLLVVRIHFGRRGHGVYPDEAAGVAAEEVLAPLVEQHACARATAEETRTGRTHRRRGNHAAPPRVNRIARLSAGSRAPAAARAPRAARRQARSAAEMRRASRPAIPRARRGRCALESAGRER